APWNSPKSRPRPASLLATVLGQDLEDGVLNASLRADSSDAQQVLRDALTQLRSRLELEGVRAGQLSVDDGRANANGGQRQAASQNNQSAGRERSSLPTQPEAIVELAESDDNLDVRL
ncbi:MAG: flagellar hook-length control protein FliK, partial [Actinomycetota bacterium]|nr:flagellar hook-length control protein FliK [Actinomycetota bacterium]